MIHLHRRYRTGSWTRQQAWWTLCVLAYACVALPVIAEPLTITDYRGVTTTFPAGETSFADRVVSSDPGNPKPADRVRRLESILGKPDFDNKDGSLALTLGCGGFVVLEFVDNALTNVEGDDLHIFEIGPSVEPTRLAVSNDGKTWEDIGLIQGGKSAVDLSDFGVGDEAYRFVRLTDQKRDCGGQTPGADIDAVGAIGSAKRVVFNASALFDVDKSILRPEARDIMREFAEKIVETRFSRLKIVGHTDSQGSTAYNRDLGNHRAMAVASYLAEVAPRLQSKISTESKGELEPVASNDTDEGRQKNRRVEVIVFD